MQLRRCVELRRVRSRPTVPRSARAHAPSLAFWSMRCRGEPAFPLWQSNTRLIPYIVACRSLRITSAAPTHLMSSCVHHMSVLLFVRCKCCIHVASFTLLGASFALPTARCIFHVACCPWRGVAAAAPAHRDAFAHSRQLFQAGGPRRASTRPPQWKTRAHLGPCRRAPFSAVPKMHAHARIRRCAARMLLSAWGFRRRACDAHARMRRFGAAVRGPS